MAANQQIIVSLTANASQFTAGTSQAQRALANFNQGINAATNSTVKFRAANGQFITTVGAAKQVVAQLRAEKARLAQIDDLLTKNLSKQDMALLKSTGLMQGSASAAGSASFALLSLGQGFQDSAQFSLGFAQGMRAINNNIQQFFTATVLASAQAGGFRNLLGQMRSQLWGPAGLIIAFSAASAAVEFFSNRSQQAKKETNLFTDALRDSADAMLEADKQREVRFKLQAEQFDAVIANLNEQVRLSDELAAKEERLAKLKVAAFDMSDRIPALEQEIADLRAAGVQTDEREIKAKEAVLEVVKRRQAEYEAERLIRAELEKIGAAEIRGGMTILQLSEARTREAREQYDRASRLPPILDDQIALYKSIAELDKVVTRETKDRAEREADITAEKEAQLRAAQQQADTADELPLGELDLGRRLITDMDRAMQQLNRTFSRTAAEGIVQVGQGLMDMVVGGESFKAAILGPLADMAIQLGKVAIATGIAMKGIRFSFKNPATAIAAGAALIAVGSAVKASIGKIGYSTSGSSASAVGGDSAIGAAPGFVSKNPLLYGSALSPVMTAPAQPIYVTGMFEMRGRDLVAVVESETRAQQEMGVRTGLVLSR